MNTTQSLSYSKWECKYHVRYRKKAIYGQVHKYLGVLLRELARQKESFVLEGHLMTDHIHVLVSILPKYFVDQVIGYINGKSAIHIVRNFFNARSSSGQKFWARGYHVSSEVRDEEVIRRYIKERKKKISEWIS